MTYTDDHAEWMREQIGLFRSYGAFRAAEWFAIMLDQLEHRAAEIERLTRERDEARAEVRACCGEFDALDPPQGWSWSLRLFKGCWSRPHASSRYGVPYRHVWPDGRWQCGVQTGCSNGIRTAFAACQQAYVIECDRLGLCAADDALADGGEQ